MGGRWDMVVTKGKNNNAHMLVLICLFLQSRSRGPKQCSLLSQKCFESTAIAFLTANLSIQFQVQLSRGLPNLLLSVTAGLIVFCTNVACLSGSVCSSLTVCANNLFCMVSTCSLNSLMFLPSICFGFLTWLALLRVFLKVLFLLTQVDFNFRIS